jgi:hypothetical protein
VLADRAEIVSEVEDAGRLNAGKDARLPGRLERCHGARILAIAAIWPRPWRFR